MGVIVELIRFSGADVQNDGMSGWSTTFVDRSQLESCHIGLNQSLSMLSQPLRHGVIEVRYLNPSLAQLVSSQSAINHHHRRLPVPRPTYKIQL